jgi:hypothetical protein
MRGNAERFSIFDLIAASHGGLLPDSAARDNSQFGIDH